MFFDSKTSFNSPVVAAQQSTSEAPSTPQRKPSTLEQFMPFVFILAIVYFLFIRPQQKRTKQHAEFTRNLKVGDSVLTSGGVLGEVNGLTEQYVILNIANNTKIRVLRSHISSFSNSNKQQKPSTTSSK